MRHKEIIIGEFDFDAENDPLVIGLKHHTWSLAIFRWVRGKKGVRRGHTCYRIRGEAAYAIKDRQYYNKMNRRASQLCEAFNKEKTDWQPVGKKSEWVRG